MGVPARCWRGDVEGGGFVVGDRRGRTSRRSSSQAPEGTDIWLLTPAPCEYCIARGRLMGAILPRLSISRQRPSSRG